MAPPLDDYTIQMRNLHKRYNLSPEIMALFRKMGDHHHGYEDPDALGRLMRMSLNARKTCTDTISHLAKAMQKKCDQSTISECTELIQGCTELLSLANEVITETRFPLMKLPLEVRRRIYLGYFSNLFRYHEDTHILICRHDVSKCRCLRHDNSLSHAVDLQLARVSRTLRDEVLACWYETQKFYVNCGCELKELLTTNASLHNNIRFLKLHWTGPQSAAGFKLLADVPKLKSLVIVISKSTTNVLSARENELQKYFAHRFQARLTDALGFEELGALRGLTQIKVVHIDKSQTHRRTNEERCGLEAYLKDKMQAES